MSKTEKTAAVITSIILLSNVIGYVREMLLAKYFGATYIIDAYLMAYSIAFILFTGIMAAISTSFIPLYSSIKEQKGLNDSNLFASGVINMTLLFSTGLALLGILCAGPIVSLFAYGFSGQAHDLTVHFVRTGFMVVSVISILEIVKAYLYCNEGFVFEKAAGLVVNIASIIFIVLSAVYNYQWLMYGYLLGYSANLLLCLYFARLKGFRYRINLPARDTLKKIAVLVIPVFIGSTAGQINGLVDRFLASGLSEGSVSFLGYAGTVKGMLMSLFTSAIFLIIYPNFSGYIARNDLESFKHSFARTLKLLTIILVPLTCGTVVLAGPGLSVLYERGQFGAYEVAETSGVLALLSIGMLGSGISGVISKAFYAVQDSKTPMRIGILSIMLNIVFSLLLIKPLAYNGLALSDSLAATLTVIPFALLLRKKFGRLDYRSVLFTFLKCTGAALLMSIAAHEIYYGLTNALAGDFLSRLFALAAAVGAGVLIYLILLWLLRVKEITVIINSLIRKV